MSSRNFDWLWMDWNKSKAPIEHNFKCAVSCFDDSSSLCRWFTIGAIVAIYQMWIDKTEKEWKNLQLVTQSAFDIEPVSSESVSVFVALYNYHHNNQLRERDRYTRIFHDEGLLLTTIYTASESILLTLWWFTKMVQWLSYLPSVEETFSFVTYIDGWNKEYIFFDSSDSERSHTLSSNHGIESYCHNLLLPYLY